MKRLLTILLLIVSANVFGQLQPQPSGTLTPLTTNQAYFRASDSTYYFYNGTNYLWNYFLNKQQADKLYQPINSPSATPFSLSTGYGLVGSSFDGSVARTWTADTASAGGLVSKSRLATNLGGYVPKTTTLTINGATRDLSTNRVWNVGTVTSVGATAGTGISVTGSPIASSGNITITNTAPDQTVTLTGGTGIATSGTYPNFTITNTSPSPSGLQDSLTKKANRTFDNVASGAIAKAKVDTSANGLLPKSNLFPLGDTRYVKKSGDTMTGTLNGTDIVLSDNIKATGLNSTGQATLGSLNQGGKMNFVSGGTGAVGGTLGFSTNATTNILSLQNIQGLELTSTNSNGYVAVRATGANGSINFRTGSNINGYVHPSGNWSFQNGGTYTDNGYRIDVNGTGRFTSTLTANSFVKSGGTSSEFLKGDGSVTSLGTSAISLGGTANGLSYSGGNYRLHKVTATTGGVLTTGTDTIAGRKFFNDDIIFKYPSAFFISSIGATTGGSGMELANTGGQARLGIEGSIGNTFFSSATAYATVFGTPNNTPIEFYTNNTRRLTIANSGGISATGSISSTPQGTLYGTASGSITSAQLATSLSDETGTGSAVFSASPTFTGTVTGADAHFSGSLGIGISPTFPFHVSKSLSNNYVAQLTNTNTTAGTSFGLFINAGTNGSDRAININNAANTLTLLTSYGNGDFEIGGSNATKASGTAWINPSDLRLKKNIGEYSKGLKEVLQIKPKTWYFNEASGFDKTKKHLSPIAQELQQIMPEMVSTYKGKLNGKEQELLQVDASDMTWLLVKAIQEQQAIIEKLNLRITVLEQK